jgi:hypothetical protein
METSKKNIMCLLLVMFVVSLCSSQQAFAEDEESGNNLSLPVIWADGITKVLRGTFGEETIGGDLWWAWTEVIEEEEVEKACLAELPDQVDCSPPEYDAFKVYPQRDPTNTWQAESLSLDPLVDPPVDVTFVDWGDNLEAKDWKLRSIIRTETILYQDISDDQMMGYEMRHLDGLGIDEVWGTTLNTYMSDEATVYTGCARLTIQRLLGEPYKTEICGEDEEGEPIYCRVPMENDELGLTWNPNTSEWEEVNPEDPIVEVGDTYFNSAVWEATGSQDNKVYSAEINVKGKVIYGYNWDTGEKDEDLHYDPGYYRITFSMDPDFDNDGTPDIALNTVFDTTQVLLAEEDPDSGDENNNETGGGIAVIDHYNDVSYIDVQLKVSKGRNGYRNK